MSKYRNMITGEMADKLPDIRVVPDGWREVAEINEVPQDGYKVTATKWVDDGNACRLVIDKQVSIAQANTELDAMIAKSQAELEAQAEQAKIADADFTTWTRHERFLLSLIQRIAPDLDLAKEYESLK